MFSLFKKESSPTKSHYTLYLKSWEKLKNTGNIKYLKRMYDCIIQEQRTVDESSADEQKLDKHELREDDDKKNETQNISIKFSYFIKNIEEGTANVYTRTPVNCRIDDKESQNTNEYVNNKNSCLNHFISNDILSVLITIDNVYIYEFCKNILEIISVNERRLLVKSLNPLFMKRCCESLKLSFVFFKCIINDYFLFYNLNNMAFIIDWYVLLLFDSEYTQEVEKCLSYFFDSDKWCKNCINHEKQMKQPEPAGENKRFEVAKNKMSNLEIEKNCLVSIIGQSSTNSQYKANRCDYFYKNDICEKIREHLLLTNSFQILMDKVFNFENIEHYKFLNLLIGSSSPILTLKTENLKFLHKCLKYTNGSILTTMVDHILHLFILNIKNVTFPDFIIFDSFFIEYPDLFIRFLRKETEWSGRMIIERVRKIKFSDIETDIALSNVKNVIETLKKEVKNKIGTLKIPFSVAKELDDLTYKYDLLGCLLKMKIRETRVFILISLFQRNTFLSNFDEIAQIVGEECIKMMLIGLIL